MYGTVARMMLKPGLEEKMQELSTSFEEARIPGAVMTTIYRMDNNPNEIYMAVVFDSKEAYHANANSPEQNSRYEQMMQMLAAPPEWHDGEIIQQLTYQD